MRYRGPAMELLLLRATIIPACLPAVRSIRSVGLSAARAGYRSTTPTASFSSFSSASPDRAATPTSDETETTTVSTNHDDRCLKGAANYAGNRRGTVEGNHVQPLLWKHMEDLATRNRRTVKTRQHVNPLAATFQQPVDLPEGWFHSAFENPNAPLLVDIGCAKGTFLMSMAKAYPDQNFLGLEIRRPIAALALARTVELGTRNCHPVCCNVNVDLDAVLSEAARNGASIDTICIQFPDPHFKTKHYKRRIVQPELVECIERHLRPGGALFMQSDVLDVLEDMRIITRETAELLEDSRPDMEDWMEGPEQNPFGVQTEREKVTYGKELPAENRVYRCMFVKKLRAEMK